MDPAKKWVTQAVNDTLDAAIATATAALDTVTTDQEVTEAADALDAAVVTYNAAKADGTLEVDTTAPTFEGITPAEGAVELAHDANFILTVTAADENLYELEVDHSLAASLPEFSVYASATDPYGSAEDAAAFAAAGVVVTYDADAQEWTIDFGEAVTNAIVANEGVTFYLVIKDEAGNEWGTMYGTTPENTFSYTITQAADPIAEALDVINTYMLTDGVYDEGWYKDAARINTDLTGALGEALRTLGLDIDEDSDFAKLITAR